MTDDSQRSWGLSEQHLMPDAVVAFVDGELTPTAWDRASAHIAKCVYCATEISAQRQVKAAVRGVDAVAAPDWLLSALRSGIRQTVDDEVVHTATRESEHGQLHGSGLSASAGRTQVVPEALPILGRSIDHATHRLNEILNRIGPPPEPLATEWQRPKPDLPAGVS